MTYMTSKNPHTELTNQIIKKYDNSPYLYLWKNNTGSAKIGQRFVSFGKKGSPDIIGFAADGRFVAIECKTGTGKLDATQLAFALQARRFNCIYIVARDLNCIENISENVRIKHQAQMSVRD